MKRSPVVGSGLRQTGTVVESTAADDPVEDRWLLILDDPVVGILPWIAFGLLPNIASFMVSTLIAAALAAAIVIATFVRGERRRSWNCPTWCSSPS